MFSKDGNYWINYFYFWCRSGKSKTRYFLGKNLVKWLSILNQSTYTFKEIGYFWTNRKRNAKSPNICLSVEPILLTFPSSYIVESRFSHVHYSLSKQRSTLNIQNPNLRLKITNLQSNIRDPLSMHQTHLSHLKIIQDLKVHLHLKFTDSFLMEIVLNIR